MWLTGLLKAVSTLNMGKATMPEHLCEKTVVFAFSVGDILSKYRSGKLPKAFKIIPSLQNWEEVLQSLTMPLYL